MDQSSNEIKKNLKNSKRKFLEEQEKIDNNFVTNLYKNLPFFSYKILEAKYNSTPDLYQQIILNNLIIKKKTHLLAYINEIGINSDMFRELLKRKYTYQESKERIPKYVSYYQNYLKFFCRPIFSDYISNRKMVKHMEVVAQIFYNENYADEDEIDKSQKPQKFNFKVFNRTVRDEIDNYDNYTNVDNDNENDNFFKMKSRQNNNDNEDMKSKTIDINKKIKELKLLEEVYKITPILEKSEYRKNKNKNNKKKEDVNSKTTEYNSFQKILKEMDNKKGIKSKENTHKKNKMSSHNTSIFDYFNSLSSILFSKKKKTFLYKNNSLNKFYKKKGKNNYNTNNNKIINNINININHLTIGQKSINPLCEINNIPNSCLFSKYKKRNMKTRKNNSMILKDKSFKNYVNCFGNLTSKNFEKKKSNSFKYVQQGNTIIGYNSNKYRKITNINYNSNRNNSRNKSNFKREKFAQLNNGYITSFSKNIIKKKNNSKNKLGKMTIYTNSGNYTKNMYNILDMYNNSRKIRHSNQSSNRINFSNNNNHYINNSFYKNSSLSPLVWSRRHKNNISYNKSKSVISYDKIKSSTIKSKAVKKIFKSGFNFGNKNKGTTNLNFISPKNIIINNNLSKLNNNKNERSQYNRNISSPINIEKIPVINKYNSVFIKKKFLDNYSKAINLKFKNLVKLSCLKKNLKIIPKQSRTKSKSKGKNNNKNLKSKK